MNSIFQKHKWLRYVIGSFVVALGVLIIILACLSTGQVPSIVNVVLSVGLMLLGLFLLVTMFLSETHKTFTTTMIVGTLLIAAGIFILVARFYVRFSIDPQLLVYFISILTLSFGTVALAKGVSLIIFKERAYWIIIMFLIAIAGITLGILGLCFVGRLVTAAYIILGIALMITGILLIVFAILADKKQSE